VKFPKTNSKQYNIMQFLNPTRTRQKKLKTPISALLAVKETLSRSDL